MSIKIVSNDELKKQAEKIATENNISEEDFIKKCQALFSEITDDNLDDAQKERRVYRRFIGSLRKQASQDCEKFTGYVFAREKNKDFADIRRKKITEYLEDHSIEEAKEITKDKDFKGYIHDVGGPTANFRHPSCKKQMEHGVCKTRQCLFPSPCKNLDADHRDYVSLLRKLRDIPKVKKVFIRSGIRFDYLLADKKQEFLRELCEYHVSGQLKVAPEHVAGPVLSLMGKPEHKVYEEFTRQFYKMNEKIGKEQYLVPYLMSSHPGSTLKEAVELAEYCRDLGYMPEQVQDFYPTPSTLSTCMYYTGVDPRTMQKVYVPKSPHEKAMQRALIQYRNPELYDLVIEALHKAGRSDLIGFGPKCLVRPRQMRGSGNDKKAGRKEPKKGSKGSNGQRRQNNSEHRGRVEGKNKKKSIRNVHSKKNRK